jgi:hypothetical protein
MTMKAFKAIEDLAGAARREGDADKARQAIADAGALAAEQQPDAGLSTLIYALNLRATWGLGFEEAFPQTVLALETSPLTDIQKKGHRRAIAAVAKRQLENYPFLQTWLDAADLTITAADMDELARSE